MKPSSIGASCATMKSVQPVISAWAGSRLRSVRWKPRTCSRSERGMLRYSTEPKNAWPAPITSCVTSGFRHLHRSPPPQSDDR